MRSALRRALVCSLALPVLAGLRAAAAQSSQEFPYLAALATEQPVRAGADVRYYPFGRLRQADVVRVIGVKAGCARVVTIGPAFQEFFGFIKYPKAGTSHLRLGAGTATTTGPTDVFAPNLDARFDPMSSWKPVVTLAAERNVIVIETTELDQDVVYKIALPDDAEGWIDLKALRAATAAESAVFEAAVRDAPPRPIPAARPEVIPVQQTPAARAPVGAGAVSQPAAPQKPDIVPAAQPRTQPNQAQIMLEDLEAAYTKLLKEPVETAEVGPLRLLYLDLAQRHQESRPIARFAQTRAQQLALWAEVQRRRVEMKDVLDRASQTTQSAEVSRQVIDSLGQYAAVGRLDASTIYDGQRLPKLLRIRDPKTGRTIAYVQPNAKLDYVVLLGHEVGVMGEWSDDPGLRVNLIVPRRIDPLK